MVLIPYPVQEDIRGIRIVVQHVDVTVDTPGSAELEEVQDALVDVVTDEAFVAGGPAHGHGREVTPFLVERELGGVERVGAEVRLDGVAVVIDITDTGEVGEAGGTTRRVGDVLRGGIAGLQEAQVLEVGLITLQDVRTGSGTGDVVAGGLDEGHTGHGGDVVLAEGAGIVGEVLPLVVQARIRARAQVVVVSLDGSGGEVRLGVAVGSVLGNPVTEAGGVGEALERHEVQVGDATDGDTLVGGLGRITLDERVAGLGFADERNGPVEAGLGIDEDLLAGVEGVLQAGGELALITTDGEQRGGSDGGQEGGAVVVRLGDTLGAPLLDGVVGTHGEPGLDLVVGIDLEGQTPVLVLVAPEDTVVAQVVDGGEEAAAVVTALEAHRVAVAPGGDEDFIAPVDIGLAVVVALQVSVGEITVGLTEGDVFGSVHDVELIGQGGILELVVIEHLAITLLTGLGGHEDDTVTSLGAVDGGGGGILQDLDGLDHFRIQILDVVHLQTVHDEERSEGTGVGGITTDADGGAGTRSAGSVDDLDTGGLALEGGGGVGSRTVLQVFRTDGGHGTGQVALLLDTVTDDHGLIQEFGILLEDDVEDGLVGRRECLVGVADAGHVDAGASGDVEPEGTVDIGHGADRAVADDDDGGSDDGSAGSVGNRTADSAVLGGRNRAQQAGHCDHRSGCHLCKQMLSHKNSVVLVGWLKD